MIRVFVAGPYHPLSTALPGMGQRTQRVGTEFSRPEGLMAELVGRHGTDPKMEGAGAW